MSPYPRLKPWALIYGPLRGLLAALLREYPSGGLGGG